MRNFLATLFLHLLLQCSAELIVLIITLDTEDICFTPGKLICPNYQLIWTACSRPTKREKTNRIKIESAKVLEKQWQCFAKWQVIWVLRWSYLTGIFSTNWKKWKPARFRKFKDCDLHYLVIKKLVLTVKAKQAVKEYCFLIGQLVKANSFSWQNVPTQLECSTRTAPCLVGKYHATRLECATVKTRI